MSVRVHLRRYRQGLTVPRGSERVHMALNGAGRAARMPTCRVNSQGQAPNSDTFFCCEKVCSLITVNQYLDVYVGLQTKNSSDLGSGHRPISNSDELFVCNPSLVKIWAPFVFDFLWPQIASLIRNSTLRTCAFLSPRPGLYAGQLRPSTPPSSRPPSQV